MLKSNPPPALARPCPKRPPAAAPTARCHRLTCARVDTTRARARPPGIGRRARLDPGAALPLPPSRTFRAARRLPAGRRLRLFCSAGGLGEQHMLLLCIFAGQANKQRHLLVEWHGGLRLVARCRRGRCSLKSTSFPGGPAPESDQSASELLVGQLGLSRTLFVCGRLACEAPAFVHCSSSVSEGFAIGDRQRSTRAVGQSVSGVSCFRDRASPLPRSAPIASHSGRLITRQKLQAGSSWRRDR